MTGSYLLTVFLWVVSFGTATPAADHQLLQATPYLLLTNHRGKRLNGNNSFEMLPHIYFPSRNFFFFLLVAPSSSKSQPRRVTTPGARMSAYYSEPKVHREDREDTSSKKKGGLKLSENQGSEERDREGESRENMMPGSQRGLRPPLYQVLT